MAKTRKQKRQIVKELTSEIKKAKSVIVNSFFNLSVKDDRELRAKLREEEIDYKVLKKRLFALILRKAGFKKIKLNEIQGNLSIALSREKDLEPAKILKHFAKENETFNLLGGFLDKKYFNQKEILRFADLPSKEELQAKLIYLIQSPLQKLKGILQAPQRDWLGVLKNLEKIK